MGAEVLSVAGLGALCGAWVLIQRFFARYDPDAPGVEGKCATCGRSEDCDRKDAPDPHP